MLAGTFIEWMECGEAQAAAIIANAKALGQALAERGVPMISADFGFTESHTLILIVDKYGEGSALANHLEACHIITGAARLAPKMGTSGLGIGVQEVTRWGMTPMEAPDIAACIVAALSGELLKHSNRRAQKSRGVSIRSSSLLTENRKNIGAVLGRARLIKRARIVFVSKSGLFLFQFPP